MADHVNYDHTKPVSDEPCEGATTAVAVESADRGLFGFGAKREEEAKCEETPIASEFEEKVKVSEEPEKEKEKEEEKKHGGLIEKLRRSDSSSSSCEDTSVPVEKYEDVLPAQEHEDKKGFLDKIKDKLPGGKKTEEVAAPPPPAPAPAPVVADYSATTPEAEGKEKKGFLDKIKEKLPGYHPKSDEEKEKEKEKEKEGAC
ncbi:hypothetical protein SASPL_149765 [Salvia splendens]|uniref:Dehydrin n=1 Tax=Salvia splendens TaxID=180675 RepID=A0A8X8W589_SALSN|nr:hypothetical protein SASPL_149765 [Salvia splendens]